MRNGKKHPTPAQRKSAKRLDENELAHHLIRSLTEEPGPVSVEATRSEISRVMSALGRKGGKIGGTARAASMTPERRREIALKAARKRWDK